MDDRFNSMFWEVNGGEHRALEGIKLNGIEQGNLAGAVIEEGAVIDFKS